MSGARWCEAPDAVRALRRGGTLFGILWLVLSQAEAPGLAQATQETGMPPGPGALAQIGADQTEAIRVNESIFLALGFGNSFLVTTGEGNVVIDTSLRQHAERQKRLFQKVSSAPVRYVILTHGHGDHRGGVPVWQDGRVEVIAQRNYVEFLHYQTRLSGFFARRNSAQFGGLQLDQRELAGSPGNYAAEIDATILFDDRYDFELGGVRFELYHAPGETYDHLAVWIPQFRAAFVGDNFTARSPTSTPCAAPSRAGRSTTSARSTWCWAGSRSSCCRATACRWSVAKRSCARSSATATPSSTCTTPPWPG